MRVGEGTRHLRQESHRRRHRQAPTLLQPLAKRLALDVWHGEVRQPGNLAGGQERHDVRVLKPGSEANLTLESVGAHAGSEVGCQELDNDPASQPMVMGDVGATHAAAAQFALDLDGWAQRRRELLDQGSDQWGLRI